MINFFYKRSGEEGEEVNKEEKGMDKLALDREYNESQRKERDGRGNRDANFVVEKKGKRTVKEARVNWKKETKGEKGNEEVEVNGLVVMT